ncbi:MAG: sensor histidine kinase [Cyclobacteriaceae bacterium]|nr:sensor histidine kinase [Cyclobacteriaceae bacterium]
MKYITFVFCVSIFIILTGCRDDNFGGTNRLEIVAGTLDLNEYDLINEHPIVLSGEWEMYWHQLLSPDDFSSNSALTPDTILSFPSYWNGLMINNERLGGDGYATYRLIIKNAPSNEALAIKMINAMTSYKLWVNDELLFENGNVSTDKAGAVPEFYPEIHSFQVEDGQIAIVLQISNFHHAKGGMRGEMIVGEINSVYNIREKNVVFDIFLLGAIFIISIYHFSLFFLLRKDVSTLYFGLLCLVVTIRIGATGEIFLNDYFNFPWEMILKLEYVPFIAALPAFLLFVQAIFPKETSPFLIRLFVITSLLFLLLVLVTRASIYSYLAVPYQVFILFGGMYVFYVLYKALRKKGDKSGQTYIFLFGYSILFSAVVYDLLYYNFYAQAGSLAPFGLFGFIFSQSFLLSKRYATAYKFIEAYNETLEEKVEERTVELAQKNDSLKQLNNEKDGMIDIVAHDLKSPFNNILGLSQLMKLSGKLNQEQDEYLNQIESVVGGGVNLIHDLLDMHAYDYEGFQPNFSKVSLGVFFDDWKKTYVQRLRNKNQTLLCEVEKGTEANTDKDIFSRIMDNLLTNAMKFSENGKKIWISARFEENQIRITVKDEGQGLSNEDKKLMFKPFQRLSAKPTSGESSNGLGLSIIKTLVSKINGQVEVESELGVGSSFSILLPSSKVPLL